MPLSISQDLPPRWRPTRNRVAKIERRLTARGDDGCLAWDVGVGKTQRRPARVVCNGKKFTVRALLCVWETGVVRTDFAKKKPSCGSWWCLLPAHQRWS